ncbi:YvrJ family protein [Halalkalibacillus halophilus]|nr:YvrJ family protein [Halalkalibacillus halophilus]
METWMSWLPEVGFPILVTFYLLHRIENKLEEVHQSIITIPKYLQ